ncbi:MAG TPA: hypothetical protein VHW95_02655 [Steroidobacteraceae bacterium]|nr:hypothetical protein [Steroidobacteraceae bacterium]
MPVTPTLKSCFGSTVDEFMQSAGSVFGQGLLGNTQCALNAKYNFDPQSKITKSTLSLQITSATAHWVGPGVRDGKHAPQPDGPNRHAIARAEALNKSHEQKHIDGYQSVFDNKKSEMEKKMIGQTAAEAAKTVAEMNAALKAACEALHKTEGLISVNQQGSAISIVVQPEGPGACD